MSDLSEIGIGYGYVKIGLIFRDATLKSKLLLNSEVWHGLTNKQVEMLEDMDKIYIRRLLNSHSKVAIECLYFEIGKMPWKYEVILRRFMYLWKILNVEKSELINRVYGSQALSSHPGDWVTLVESDKKKIGFDLEDEEIGKLSKNKFKTIVQKKVSNFALSELNQLKSKHSKSNYLLSNSFKTASYLLDDNFTKQETQLLFRLRSKTLDVKMNFPKQYEYESKLCAVCKLFPESQSHLLQCPEIAPKLKLVSLSDDIIEEKEIYNSDVRKQHSIVRIFSNVLEIRNKILEERKINESAS